MGDTLKGKWLLPFSLRGGRKVGNTPRWKGRAKVAWGVIVVKYKGGRIW